VKIRAGPHLFDSNEMHPAVTEIILVAKAGSFLAGDVAQADPLVTLHVVVILRVRLPVARLADEKLMEMGVFPPVLATWNICSGKSETCVILSISPLAWPSQRNAHAQQSTTGNPLFNADAGG
jgi:hypothetical protein